VTTTVTQDGQVLTLPTAPLPVTVDAVADDPLFTLAGADGAGNAVAIVVEDTASALPDAATLGLQDSGETLSLTIDISGAPAGTILAPPAGATLTPVAGQPGVFQLSGANAAELTANFNGLTLTAPANFSGAIPVVVRVTATENPAEPGDIAADNTASVAHNITVTVTPVVDTQLQPVIARGKEDLGQAADQVAAVDANGVVSGPISIPVTFANQPANETVDSVTISGVPTGVTLGVRNPDNSISPLAAAGGSVTISAAQAASLVIAGLPADSDADFQLNVSAIVSQNGTPFAAPLTSTISVLVDAVADLPTLNAPTSVAGNEDAVISLSGLGGGFNDADGSETQSFTVVFVGAPAGTQLLVNGVALVPGPGGVFSVTSAQLSQLSVQSAPDDATDFTVRATATAIENATVDPAASPDFNPAAPETGERVAADNTATTIRDIAVVVNPTADTQINPVPAAGREDGGNAADQAQNAPPPPGAPANGAIPLNFGIALGAGETLSNVVIDGAPSGAVLLIGGVPLPSAASYTLTAAQIAAGVSLVPPNDSDVNITLSVTATITQDGQSLTLPTASLPVTVDAVADDPLFTLAGADGAGNAVASTAEDNAAGLPDAATLGLQDSGETLSLTIDISGAPAGTTLVPPAGAALTPVAGQPGVFQLSGANAAELTANFNGLTLNPPANFAGAIPVVVRVTASENPAEPGDLAADNTASVVHNITVDVTPVRDTTLTVADTALKEDLGAVPGQTPAPQPPSGAQPVSITLALGPNEVATAITVAGVPAGVAFNQGTNNNNGTWSFTPAQLAGLTINALPGNRDTDFDLTVTAAVSQNGVALPVLTGNIHVTIDAVADAPSLTLSAAAASGAEDAAIALPDITAALADVDASETLALKVTGVPVGAVLGVNGVALDAARNLGNGEWSLTGLSQADLNALTLTPPANFSGAIAMSVVATATEGAASAAGVEIQTADNVATTTQNFTVDVTPVRDATLTVAPTSIKEDLGNGANQTPVPQPPSGAQPVNITLTVGPNETVTGVTIAGVPAGVTFNQGTNNNNGTWSFTQAQLTGLTINGLPQNSDSEFTLAVTAGISQNGVALPALTGNVVVTVDAVADAPVLTLSGVATTGAEDTPIALPDIASGLRDTDGSETFGLVMNISGAPVGSVLGVNGVALDAARNLGGGQWSLAGLTQAQLDGLTITPGANFSGSFQVSVTATATEGATGAGEIQTADNVATTTQNFTVDVTPVRDSTLTVAPTSIKEDLGTGANQTPVPQPPSGAQPVNITLTVGPNETVTGVTIAGVPVGVTFNQGTNNNNGTWSFTQAQLTGLTINGLPQNSDSEFTLAVTAGVSQNGVALPALTGNVVVTVDAVADAPILTLTSSVASGNENAAIALPDITSSLRDGDGSETLSLTMNIGGAPAGSVLGINGVALDAARNLGGGLWNLAGLTQAQLNGLTITPPNEFGGSFQLIVTATATEGATGAGEIQTADNVATTSQNIAITVNALPNGGQASATVSEAGNEATANFNAGTNSAADSEIATGSLGYSFDSDGQAAANPFTWGGTVTPTDPETGGALSLTSGGVGVVWSVSADGLTITGAKGAGGPVVAILQVTDVATGAFRYEQIGPFDHPDIGQSAAQDPINLAFSYTVRDASGDAATGNLNVAVQDNAPVAAPVVKSAAEQFGVNTNLLITLDVSGSMNDPSGVVGLTRLQAAKLAVAELIELYDVLGDVVIRFVTFSSGAASNAGGWLTVDQAMAFLDGRTAGGSTNYDAGITTAQTAFGAAGKIAGAQNTSYFFSDGVPNQPTGSEGINAAEQAAWEAFLRTNDIKSYAIGIGTGVTTGPLEPIGYDGVTETNLPAISVTDLAQLAATLANTVPPVTVTGSIISDPGPIGQFGADDGRVNSITIDGKTYTYNPATDAIVVTGGPSAGAFNATTNVLTVTTAIGGAMALDFDDGTYVYTLPTSIAGNTSENFQYTLIDNDGDLSNSSTVTFNLLDVNRVPLIRNDTVISNINGSGVAIPAPAWALLANDTDPDGNPLSVTGVSGAVDGAVSLATNVATFTDNDSDGGTYNYTGSDGALANNGHVIINRTQANEATLDGTGFDEILIGRTANDTILAYDGKDILIGGGGNDTLNAGAGDDIMLFQGLASNYLGGTGSDTLRIEDVVGGGLDLRAAATDDARIENIDRLSLANSNPLTVQIDYQGLLDLEADGNSLRITAGPGATSLDLSEPIAASGTNVWIKTVDTATADTYQYSPTGGGPIATLVVDNQVNVV
jgi:Bacterial Ig domain/RTX calcium-binding nonapeptide repeat (4 copies)